VNGYNVIVIGGGAPTITHGFTYAYLKRACQSSRLVFTHYAP
jgi:hypothetical protein